MYSCTVYNVHLYSLKIKGWNLKIDCQAIMESSCRCTVKKKFHQADGKRGNFTSDLLFGPAPSALADEIPDEKH
jgi:hypothetical protein